MTSFDYGNMPAGSVRWAAVSVAEGTRYINHATMRPGGLESPVDVDAVLVEFESLAGRLPQLFSQLGAWLVAEAAAGRLRVAGAPAAHSPSAEAVAVSAVRQYFTEAVVHAEALREVLHDARQITATLAPRDPE